MTSALYSGGGKSAGSLESALDEERLEVLRWMKEREEKKHRQLALQYDPIVRDYCLVKHGDSGYRMDSSLMTSLPHSRNPPIFEAIQGEQPSDIDTLNLKKVKSGPTSPSSIDRLSSPNAKAGDILASSLFSSGSPPDTTRRNSTSNLSSVSTNSDKSRTIGSNYNMLQSTKSTASQRRMSDSSTPSTTKSKEKIFSPKALSSPTQGASSNVTPESPPEKPIPSFVLSPPPVSATNEANKLSDIQTSSPSQDIPAKHLEPLHLNRSLSSSPSSEDSDLSLSSDSDDDEKKQPSKSEKTSSMSVSIKPPKIIRKGSKEQNRIAKEKASGAPLTKSKSHNDTSTEYDSNSLRRSRSNPAFANDDTVHPNTSFVSSNINNWYGSDLEELEQDVKTAKSMKVDIGPTRWIPTANRTIRCIRRGDFQTAASSSKRNCTYFLTLDLSSESLHAAEWAVGILLRNGDTLIIVDVIECDDPSARAVKDRMESEQLETLEKITKYILKLLSKTVLEVEVNIEVIHHEKAKHLIIEMIDYIEPSLVVMGSRGRSHLKGVLLGSFSNYLVNKSSVPVMVARKKLKKNKQRLGNQSRLANNLSDAIVDEVGRTP
ncbi:Usp (universal stress protein) family protein [Schizosaccharomyces pombe]|uniref:Uncharacterized protein C167.05 n=1 Tax=Schizosaccharomyces pombe (strain 972 / ATCC 24843) TaxID=284812 RepID=YFK5_SCHPO|nr:uncharacterized protein SPAC167.05 [Schizosaccharomyces pombe]P87132.2 RecName: Full=Uncharacterized protein C167.05 [Schizosaccharomyces pombe 972h-]CAB08759.2 Usp (universal stress protein) family protein, implicated in meiotic chromosome segregation [Schizosaccharomyces pombe]|eukprot:NP_001342825.1 uncharacterized protein SPAC167.05 [Schizosaccharomyces pombe]